MSRNWKEKYIIIKFNKDYINKQESFVSQDSNFRKKENDRIKEWKKNIQDTQDKKIMIETQNGCKDVNRHYIGQTPHRRKKNKTAAEKENIKK